MKKIKVEICIGTSCYLLGAHDLMEAVENLPQEIKKCIDLNAVTCLKTCGKGPNICINDVVLSGITPQRLLEIIHDTINDCNGIK